MTLQPARSSWIWLLTCCGVGIAATAVSLVRHVDDPWSVVVVTLDTTRADRLSPYGLMDISMPALERLAREGVVFDRATTVAPLTLPAHASLFTGLFPPAHGVHDNASPPLSGTFVTLAEVLHARGRRTAAFVATAVLDADRGLAQGFERYQGIAPSRSAGAGSPLLTAQTRQRRGDDVVTDAIRWLDGIDEAPFLMWAHLYDAHRPYDPPEPYRSRHADPYVAEIAFMDAQIGRLLDALAARGRLARTIIIVAGDHGESLGEHGEDDHGIFVYESVLRVPLIVRAPSVPPRRVGAVVRLPDVMPTILDLLGMSGLTPAMDGVSLVPLLNGQVGDLGLDAYAESEYPERMGWSALHTLSDGRYKVIDAPRPELYDLEQDPFEARNIYRDRPALAGLMVQRLRWLARPTGPVRPDATPPAELTARLTALGYVGSRARPELPRDLTRPDPKDCIGELAGRLPDSSFRIAHAREPAAKRTTCR